MQRRNTREILRKQNRNSDKRIIIKLEIELRKYLIIVIFYSLPHEPHLLTFKFRRHVKIFIFILKNIMF